MRRLNVRRGMARIRGFGVLLQGRRMRWCLGRGRVGRIWGIWIVWVWGLGRFVIKKRDGVDNIWYLFGNMMMCTFLQRFFILFIASLTSAGKYSLTRAPAPLTPVMPCCLSLNAFSNSFHALSIPSSPLVFSLSWRSSCNKLLLHIIVSSAGRSVSLRLRRESSVKRAWCSCVSLV